MTSNYQTKLFDFKSDAINYAKEIQGQVVKRNIMPSNAKYIAGKVLSAGRVIKFRDGVKLVNTATLKFLILYDFSEFKVQDLSPLLSEKWKT